VRERHLHSVARPRFKFDSPSDLTSNFPIRSTLFTKSIGFYERELVGKSAQW
jgi:hypothetical protein